MMETTKSAELLRIARNALGKRSAKAEEGVEAGFTLIELMVVLLIMAILLAIAIPTFLGVKGGAQDRAAQSNLTNGLTNAEVVYQNGSSYGTTASAVAGLTAAEPNLSFSDTSLTVTGASNDITVDVGNGEQQIVMVDFSPNNSTCWGVSNNQATGTTSSLGGAPVGTAYAAWNAPNGSSDGCVASLTSASDATAVASTPEPSGAAVWETVYPPSLSAASGTTAP